MKKQIITPIIATCLFLGNVSGLIAFSSKYETKVMTQEDINHQTESDKARKVSCFTFGNKFIVLYEPED